MTRADLWEKLWGEYIEKLRRIDELKAKGRYGYQLRMPYKSLKQAEEAVLKEFPEARKYIDPPPRKPEMGNEQEANFSEGREPSYDGQTLSYSDLMLTVSYAREAMERGDLSRALEILEISFGQTDWWLRQFGSSPKLEKIMDAVRRLAAEVRARMSTTTLQGPMMGLHSQEEQIEAVDMAADALSRGLDAAAANNLFGIATEVGYLRALQELAVAEGAQALATIAQQNADALVSRFRQLYEEIG